MVPAILGVFFTVAFEIVGASFGKIFKRIIAECTMSVLKVDERSLKNVFDIKV